MSLKFIIIILVINLHLTLSLLLKNHFLSTRQIKSQYALHKCLHNWHCRQSNQQIYHNQALKDYKHDQKNNSLNDLSDNETVQLKIRLGKRPQFFLTLVDQKSNFKCYPNRPFLKTFRSQYRSYKINQIQQFVKQNLLKDCEQTAQLFLQKFKGERYTKSSQEYINKTYQYATTSYPPEKLQPFMLVVPKDVKDISIIIQYAKLMRKKVVARSGGNQYSGLSSGGNETIVVSMDHFNKMIVKDRNKIEVEACVTNTDFDRILGQNKISLPHGQCPLINIGGGVQTGGYGSFSRTLGLLLDHVTAFQIVLANGQHKTLYRPEPGIRNLTDQQLSNFRLFRAVLGGNAGSFGIVTKYYMNGILDQDHPHSHGFCMTRFYSQSTFQKIFNVYRNWTTMVEQRRHESIKELNLRFVLTGLFNQSTGQKQTFLLFAGIYTDPTGKKPYQNQLDYILDDYSSDLTEREKKYQFPIASYNASWPLSQLSQTFVRKYPGVTKSGRQYDLPYKKRGSLSVHAFKDEFIKEFIKQVTQIVQDKALTLFAQLFVGAGAGSQPKALNGMTITSAPFRNLTSGMTFQVFYSNKIDPEAQSRAIKHQQRMQKTISQHYNLEGEDKNYFWCSYGDVDMNKEEVILKYYESLESYHEMQAVKQSVDPTDLFHTLMTVKLPTSN